MCGRSDVKLDVHHITNRKMMPNGGYVKENGITLCDCYDVCHFRAEQFNCGYTEWYIISNIKNCPRTHEQMFPFHQVHPNNHYHHLVSQ